jgi:HEPN domain-containing protein
VRREAEDWWKQALADLEAAEKIAEARIYFSTAFHSQQAAEKALKALHLEKMRKLPPPTHNLFRLAEGVGAPRSLQSPLATLNPAFVTSRYPDAANGVPAEGFDERSAKIHLAAAREVVEWVREQLSQMSG